MSGVQSAIAHEVRDLDDIRIALYRDSRDADLRGRHGLFLVESEACLVRWLTSMIRRHEGELLPPALTIESLLLTPEIHARQAPLIDRAFQGGPASLFVAERALIERISGFDHHHGALGLGRRSMSARADLAMLLRAAEPERDPRPLLVTDGVVHVDNMGSIFRNAAALGAAGVLLSPRSADPLTRKAVRISMGHVFGVPWAEAPSLSEALDHLRQGDRSIVVAENSADAIDLDRAALPAVSAVIFGAEGHGVSAEIMARADLVVRVRSMPDIPLNVAVTSAIVLHELRSAERKNAAGG
ncbi:MAG: hypothetical protein KF724_07190 [Phycisphaeraceae bacterium]|nr:hypothetical protein [Phycisphaeraceae bacterium]